MALAIDGTPATGIATGTNVVTTAALTTPTTADIIVVVAGAEWLSAVGSAGSISSVTGTGLTFQKRSSHSNLVAALTGNSYNDMEVWWAYSSAALSAVAIVVTWTKPGGTNNFDGACVVAFGVTGFTGTAYQTAPWDNNASLPVILDAGTNGSATAVQVTGVSTTASATMMLGSFSQSNSGGGITSNGTGYTLVSSADETAGTNFSSEGVEYQVFSSPQSSVTVAFATSRIGWIMIADALAQIGGDILQAQACL